MPSSPAGPGSGSVFLSCSPTPQLSANLPLEASHMGLPMWDPHVKAFLLLQAHFERVSLCMTFCMHCGLRMNSDNSYAVSDFLHILLLVQSM